MNIRNIVKEIEQADHESYQQLSGRRDMLKSFGTKVALASLPLAIGSLFFSEKAAAKTTDSVMDTLNFALSLSYVQYNFFYTAINTGGLIPENSSSNQPGFNDMPGFRSISDHERAHIVFLNTAITALGGTPYTPKFFNPTDLNPYHVPTAYDFTVNGTYPDVFSDYPSFLLLAQVMQDTMVRALKNQVLAVSSNTTVLKQLMQMHSTEARQASYIRTVRRYSNAGGANNEHPAPWITNDISPTTQLLANYDGEDNLLQTGGITIDELPNKWTDTGVVPKISATAAFDEPLDSAVVNRFFNKFMVV